MKKILITGANGFIGKNIAEKINYTTYTPRSNELNLLNEQQTTDYLEQNAFDIVIHSAKRDGVHERKRLSDFEVLDSNLQMFYNLEKNKHLFGKMIYFGSGAEYNRTSMPPKVQESYFGMSIPKDAYGFSKYIMSKEAEKDNNIYDLRLFGVYGKYEAWDRRFISNAIYRALNGQAIMINQNVFFDYLYIDDLVEVLIWFIENTPKHKHYNVCSGISIDLLTLAQMVRECIGIDCDIEVATDGLKPEYSGDNFRLLQEVDYSFLPHQEAICRLIEYYKNEIV